QTSTFKFKDADHGARLFKGEEEGYIYTRMRNPTVEAMEDAVAVLEGGYKALGCGSGMAAIHTLFAALLKQGDHIICSESVYGPTTTLLTNYMSGFGIEYTFVDTSDNEAVKNAVKDNTKLIFVETPGNPTLVMTDLEAVSKIAKEAGAFFAVDNTFMSPILQNPFEWGSDFIIHSMTKFLNGHADVVAGIIIVKDEKHYGNMRKVLNHLGGTIDPFNSFLVHRGIKTLKLRVEKQCESAVKIAEFLESHPKIEWVKFPGLKSHPQYHLTEKQMRGFGAMIAFEVKGGIEGGKTLMNNVEIWQLAVSLGGVESLIQHPASMTHAGMSKTNREQAGITDGLVRISIGIEDVDELIDGLSKGLDVI
ncbi:MAG: trans-sulfuration enzyme family protein, partial [Candidatus Kapaibacterium sp.]